MLHGYREAVAVVISRQRGGYIRVEYPLVGMDILFDFSYISIDVSDDLNNFYRHRPSRTSPGNGCNGSKHAKG